jgi:hypothetical protein
MSTILHAAVRVPAWLVVAALWACASNAVLPRATGDQTVPRPDVRERVPEVRHYVAARATSPITIDGHLDERAWTAAPWTESFTDIEGAVRPAPRFRTRARMLWDDHYWYVAAELEEPDLWATIRERDAVIFRDNDFEIFVDPSQTTHRYFEIEMNQLATVWDLFLPKPYRDEGSADNSWNIDGLKIAVALDGTLNDPRDRDRHWTVELAIPWAAFADSGRNHVPPRAGDQWKLNFSRVEWDVDTAHGGYIKRKDSAGAPLPEHNWVWSPQGAVNMHLPELWGVVQFGGGAFQRHPADDAARWALRRIYYAERLYHQAHGSYAAELALLGMQHLPAAVRFRGSSTGWSADLGGADGTTWTIGSDGLVTRR